MDIIPYLDRIGWKTAERGQAVENLATLQALHELHVRAFPFENLDLFLSGQISLEPSRLFDKLVIRRRGGWCFELNGLLQQVLTSLGFETRALMARNLTAPGKPRTHMVLLVFWDGLAWLADTGFGGTVLRRPMLFREGQEDVQDGIAFQLDRRPGAAEGHLWEEPPLWVLQTRKQGQWSDLYGFSLEEWEPQDFSVANHFHVTSPVSSFPQARLVNRITPTGRQSLVDRTFRQFRQEDGEEKLVEERILTSAEEYRRILKDHLSLDVTAEQADRLYGLGQAPSLVDSGFYPEPRTP